MPPIKSLLKGIRKVRKSIPSRKYTIGQMLPAENGKLMDYNPFPGTRLQLYDLSMDAVLDALTYPHTLYFLNRAVQTGAFTKEEVPELVSLMEDANLFGGLKIQSYDEGLKWRGLNEFGYFDLDGNLVQLPFDEFGNLNHHTAISVNPDFNGTDIKTTPYHEVGGHGFNSWIQGDEDENLILKLQFYKRSGIKDLLIFSAATQAIMHKFGLSQSDALAKALGYTMAAKYPMIYRLLKYNWNAALKHLVKKPNITIGKEEEAYLSEGDELSTRARTGHIDAAAKGKKNPTYTLDMEGAETVYTPESLKKFQKAVLSILGGVPLFGAISNNKLN